MLATSGQSWRCYGVTSWHPRHRTCDCQRRLGEHLPPLLQGGISLKVVQAAGGQLPAPRIPVQHRQLGIPAPQSHCSANSGSIGRGLDVQRQWRPGARHRLMAGQGSDGPDASPGLQRRAGRRQQQVRPPLPPGNRAPAPRVSLCCTRFTQAPPSPPGPPCRDNDVNLIARGLIAGGPELPTAVDTNLRWGWLYSAGAFCREKAPHATPR